MSAALAEEPRNASLTNDLSKRTNIDRATAAVFIAYGASRYGELYLLDSRSEMIWVKPDQKSILQPADQPEQARSTLNQLSGRTWNLCHSIPEKYYVFAPSETEPPDVAAIERTFLPILLP